MPYSTVLYCIIHVLVSYRSAFELSREMRRPNRKQPRTAAHSSRALSSLIRAAALDGQKVKNGMDVYEHISYRKSTGFFGVFFFFFTPNALGVSGKDSDLGVVNTSFWW